MNELPKRKHPRMKNYDYSENGYYFVTVCTADHKEILSTVNVKKVIYIDKLWQASFYDHIIRNENDYIKHYNYIEDNPVMSILNKHEI